MVYVLRIGNAEWIVAPVELPAVPRPCALKLVQLSDVSYYLCLDPVADVTQDRC